MGQVALNTIIMIAFVTLVIRLTGKRQIGELQIGELVVTFMISDLASLPMQNPDIPVSHAILAIAILIAFEVLLSLISMKSVKLRKLLEGRPSVLIENGKIDQKELRRVRFTVDDLVESLRQGGALSADEVQTAILETNGKLSVFRKASAEPPSAEALGIAAQEAKIPYTVISDGRVLSMNLERLKMDEKQLNALMRRCGVTDRKDILYFAVTADGKSVLIRKEEKKKAQPKG